MSFNDISPAKASTSSKAAAARSSNDISSSFNDPIQRLSDLLQSFQKNLKIIKDKIVEYRRRRIGLAEKSELDTNIKELKDFQKIKLAVGETKTVTFVIDNQKLSFYNNKLEFKSEAGDFELMIGASSQDIRLKSRFELLP